MKLDSEEILKCLCFVILGYFIAMMFSRMCSCGNGFSVGGQVQGQVNCNAPHNQNVNNKHFRCDSLAKTINRTKARNARTRLGIYDCPKTGTRQSLINHHRGRANPLPQIHV